MDCDHRARGHNGAPILGGIAYSLGEVSWGAGTSHEIPSILAPRDILFILNLIDCS